MVTRFLLFVLCFVFPFLEVISEGKKHVEVIVLSILVGIVGEVIMKLVFKQEDDDYGTVPPSPPIYEAISYFIPIIIAVIILLI